MRTRKTLEERKPFIIHSNLPRDVVLEERGGFTFIAEQERPEQAQALCVLLNKHVRDCIRAEYALLARRVRKLNDKGPSTHFSITYNAALTDVLALVKELRK